VRLNTQTDRLICMLAASVACLSLAVPSASARFYPVSPDGPSSCQTQWTEAFQVPAAESCEEQVLASHGTAAPAAPGRAATEPGFQWGSAAIGAAGAAVLIALLGFGAPALRSRRRVPTVG
jgi:hypothetical protein